MKKLMVRIIIFLSFTTFLISCNSDKKVSKQKFENASQTFLKKDYVNGLKIISESIQLDSSNIDAFILKAKFDLRLESYENAIEVLESQLSKNFKLDTINCLLGEAYFGLGHYYIARKEDPLKKSEVLSNAIKYYDQAINYNPKYFNAYLGKQSSLHNNEKYDEALITLNSALKLFPDSLVLVYNRGIEKIYLGDKKEAKQDINQALRGTQLDSSNYATALRFRANIFISDGLIDSAIIDLTNALIWDAKDEFIYVTRANLYRQKGLKDLACKDYRKAAELGMVAIYQTIKEYCN
jgi:tetratricopeptide (TPR) repeat protein